MRVINSLYLLIFMKPENLLVSAKDRLKICASFLLHSFSNMRLGDFGVAQCLDNSRQNIASSKGSPAFLAPEVFSSTLLCSYRIVSHITATNGGVFRGQPVDVWAAGITLNAFLFGKVPFHGDTLIQLVENVKTQEYPLLLS